MFWSSVTARSAWDAMSGARCKKPATLWERSAAEKGTNLRPLLLLLLVVALISPVFPARLSAQSQQFVGDSALTSDDRERVFHELVAEVAALEKQGSILKKVVRLATPTVVHIEAKKSSQVSYSGRPREEAGSGVIVELNGKTYILTNRHVIDEAPLADIHVKLSDGQLLRPSSVWTDRRTDIAVMAVTAKDLVAARIGDSEAIDIGDFVLAVGSPFGLSHSVTYGIISAKGRRRLQLGDGGIRYKDFFQTDAAINPGNSGGPLLNLRGEVIGINTAIASSSGGSEGIGFAIPVSMAITVAQQLVDQGRTVRSYLGVRLTDDFGPETATKLGLPTPQGAMISGITPNTPAERADLRAQDVVLEFDGHRIEDDEHLIKVVGFTPVGKDVDVLVFRNGQLLRLRVKVEDRNHYESDG